MASESKHKVSPPPRGASFLNGKAKLSAMSLHVQRELGIIPRIGLVFSRRGLDLESLSYEALSPTMARVACRFWCSGEQERSVFHDLAKLVDVNRIWIDEPCVPATLVQGVHRTAVSNLSLFAKDS